MLSRKRKFCYENETNINPFDITPVIETTVVFLSSPDLISAEKINREWRRATLLEWKQRKTVEFRRLLDNNWALAKKNTEKRQEIIEKALDWLHRRCPNLTQLSDLRYLPWKASFNQKVAKFSCLTKLEIFAPTELCEEFFHVISMDFLVLLRQLAPNLQVFIIYDCLLDDNMSSTFSMELGYIFGEMKALVCLEIYIWGMYEGDLCRAVWALPAPEKLEILKIPQLQVFSNGATPILGLCNLVEEAKHLKKLDTGMVFYRLEYILKLLQSLSSSIEELVIPNGRELDQPIEDNVAASFAAEFHRLGNLRKLILDIPAIPTIFSKIVLENVTPELTTLGCRSPEAATQLKKLKHVSFLKEGLPCFEGLVYQNSRQSKLRHLSKIESLEFISIPCFHLPNLADFNVCPNLKGLQIFQCFPEQFERRSGYEGVLLLELNPQKVKNPPMKFLPKCSQIPFSKFPGSQMKELCLSPAYNNAKNLQSLVEAVANSCPTLEKLYLFGLYTETLEEVSEEPFQLLGKKCPKLVLLAFAEGIPPALCRRSLPSYVQVVSSNL